MTVLQMYPRKQHRNIIILKVRQKNYATWFDMLAMVTTDRRFSVPGSGLEDSDGKYVAEMIEV